ncbi:MAG: PASTA domain-containing protein, partial [Nocardioidaceae bacterium]|nr:PASTA domain-containing protein [Nocardioidaceae bacterium]
MVAVAAVMGVLVAGLAIPFAAVTGLSTRTVAEGMDKVPAKLAAEPLPQRTRILGRDGKTLATLYDQNRVNVSLADVAPIMRKAIIAIEDYRFYQHGALDMRGTLRAFVTNQANNGVTQGGSSITQQMVKMTLVNQAKTKSEREAATADTYQRKINELRYAIAFEEKYSKDWILERYLNIAYFGDGAYGIEAAARHYFSKPASDLSLTEAAMLAGLVKNPTGYDPTNYPDRAKTRRNTVIGRMAELNVVSQSEAATAEKADLGLHVRATRNGCVSSAAPFFCDYVVQFLMADKNLGKTVDERRRLLVSGGLTVKTTIDLRFQRAADNAVRNHVYPKDNAIGGLAMVQPGTGEVRALAQSRPMGSDKRRGETYLNYVVPRQYGDANGFQAGSTFKAFVLSAAISQGIPLTTSIPSPQQISIPLHSFRGCTGYLQGTNSWSPENSTGAGTFNLYTGTQQSVNTFFAQLEVRTGLCKPAKLAKAMGVDIDPHDVYPPFTLGVTDTNPLTMAGAYATFAARGKYCTPQPVTTVVNSNGKQIENYPPECNQVLRTDVADAVNDILRGVQEGNGFGAAAGLTLNQQSAGKTGTTDSNRAVWFIGYTPNMAAAAMIAGANSKGHWLTLNGQTVGGTFIEGAHGSTNAGPIWGDAMKVVQQWLPDATFSNPNPRTIEGQLVPVPSVYGRNPADASRILRKAGFTPVIGPTVDSGNAAGTVAYTSPGTGAQVGTGSAVTIYISDGTPYVPPPP